MKLVRNGMMNLCEEVKLQLYEHEGKYYVDAEDLWEWLEIKTEFRKWIQRRISQYKLICGGSVKNDQTVGNTGVDEDVIQLLREVYIGDMEEYKKYIKLIKQLTKISKGTNI